MKENRCTILFYVVVVPALSTLAKFLLFFSLFDWKIKRTNEQSFRVDRTSQSVLTFSIRDSKVQIVWN